MCHLEIILSRYLLGTLGRGKTLTGGRQALEKLHLRSLRQLSETIIMLISLKHGKLERTGSGE